MRVNTIKSMLMLFIFALSPAKAMDLYETCQLALQNDATLQSAQFSLEAARQKIPQAQSALLPSISLAANKGSTHATTSFTNVPAAQRKMNAWGWTVQLSQPLIKTDALYGYQQSKHLVAAEEANHEWARQQLILRVAKFYFGMAAAREVLHASRAEVTALAQQREQANRGFQAGTHSSMDRDEVTMRLGLARSRSIAADNDLENKREELQKIIGQPFDQPAMLRESAKLLKPVPAKMEEWVTQAALHHPAVRAKVAALDAAQQDIKKNRAQHSPSLHLVASHGGNHSSSSLATPNEFDTRARSSQLGIQLQIPLYSGGMVDAKVKESIANRNKSEAELDLARRNAKGEARQAFLGVLHGLAKIEALHAAKEAGKNAVKGNRMGYEVGLRINLDVLHAEQQFFAIKRDLALARYETLLQLLELKASAGQLDIQDVMDINAMLEKEGDSAGD